MDEREMIRKLMEILETLTKEPLTFVDSATRTNICVYCHELLLFSSHKKDCRYIKAKEMLESLRLYESLS